MNQSKDDKAEKMGVDTSGTISSANTLIGGILGLAGAPTFQKGENVIEIIKKDHKHFEELYEKYQSAENQAKHQEYAWAFIKSVVQHSEVEGLLVYPLLKLRGNDPSLQNLHDHSLAEHQQIRELLYDLDQTKIEDPLHPQKFKAAFDAVKSHATEEERDVLTQIEKNYTMDELERLGNAFQTHKYTAVTRPHPSAPLQGPFAAAANIATKPIDLARDAVRNATEKSSE